MSITIASGFKLASKVQTTDRDSVATKAELKSADMNTYPSLYIVFCEEDGQAYILNKENEDDPELGKFRPLVPDAQGIAQAFTEITSPTGTTGNELILAEQSVGILMLNGALNKTLKFKVNTDSEASEIKVRDNTVYLVVVPEKDVTNTSTPIAYFNAEDGAYKVVKYSATEPTNCTVETISDSLASPGSTFTSSTPIERAIGGIEAGETFDGLTFEQFVQKLLYPYIAPTASISHNAGKDLFDAVADVNAITSLVITANVGKKSNPIQSVTITVGDEEQAFTPIEVTNGGVFTVNYAKSIKATTQLKVVVNDGKSNIAGAKTITFVGASYSGWIDGDATADEATIKSLTKTLKNGKGAKVVGTGGANKKYVYAYPKAFGDCTSIKDVNNFDMSASTDKTEVTIDGIECICYCAQTGSTVDASFYIEFK